MLKLLGFTAVVAAGLYIAEKMVPAYVHPEKWTLLVFFVVLALISHRVTSRGIEKNKDNLVVYYFSTMLLRLVVSIGVLVFYMYTKTPDIFLLVINFFILYLLFVGFEINWLLTNLRRNSK